MLRNPFIVKLSTPSTNGPARLRYVRIRLFLPTPSLPLLASISLFWLPPFAEVKGGSQSTSFLPPPKHPAPRLAQPKLLCLRSGYTRTTDTMYSADRSGQLLPCSCCAPSHCSPRTGLSSSLSFSSPLSSGRFSFTYVPMFISNAGWQFVF